MPFPSPSVRRACRLAMAGLAGAAIVAFSFDASHAWCHGGRFLSTRWLLLLGAWIPVAALIAKAGRSRSRAGEADATAWVLLAVLLLHLFSNVARHPWFYYLSWFGSADGHPLQAGIVRFVLVTCLLAPFLLARRRLAPWLLALLVAGQILSARALLQHTGGLPLYRDDHPSFMFRLHEFSRTFPHRSVFNPWWNAGVVNSVGTSSGVSAVALPLLPLWRFRPVHEVYTPGLAFLFCFVAPLLSVASLRVLAASWTAAAAAGLMALGVSGYAFVWTLHFGTIGAGFAVAFLPLVMALTYRILVRRQADLRSLSLWLLAAFMLVQWPPGALMAAPMAAGLLWNVRRWRMRPLLRLAVAALVLLLLVLPAVRAVGIGGDLMRHVLQPPASAAAAPAARPWWLMLRQTFGTRFLEMHPLLLVLGVAGIFAWPQQPLRRWLLPPLGALLLLAAWGPLILPRMQLERMAIAAAYAAIVPASLWIGRILRRGAPAGALPRAVVLALLLLGVLTSARLYGGRGYAGFEGMPPQIERLAEWVRGHVPPEGRMLFVGRNIHAFGHGHIAYLPVLTGREMMASDYYAFPPELVDPEYPPPPWRDSAGQIAAFSRLHGVTHVITWQEKRAELLRQAPRQLRPLDDLAADGFHVFEVLRSRPSRFVAGSGTVAAQCGRLVVQPGTNTPIVVRYNWSPGLKATPPAELYPHPVANGVTFIGIRPNGAAAVTIRHGGGAP